MGVEHAGATPPFVVPAWEPDFMATSKQPVTAPTDVGVATGRDGGSSADRAGSAALDAMGER
jgi:hypothetical protein